MFYVLLLSALPCNQNNHTDIITTPAVDPRQCVAANEAVTATVAGARRYKNYGPNRSRQHGHVPRDDGQRGLLRPQAPAQLGKTRVHIDKGTSRNRRGTA